MPDSVLAVLYAVIALWLLVAVPTLLQHAFLITLPAPAREARSRPSVSASR